jgi:hypothetical protein
MAYTEHFGTKDYPDYPSRIGVNICRRDAAVVRRAKEMPLPVRFEQTG